MPASCADSLCEQFGPRSGPTESIALKTNSFLKKLILKKVSS